MFIVYLALVVIHDKVYNNAFRLYHRTARPQIRDGRDRCPLQSSL